MSCYLLLRHQEEKSWQWGSGCWSPSSWCPSSAWNLSHSSRQAWVDWDFHPAKSSFKRNGIKSKQNINKINLQQSRMMQMRASSLIALGEPPFKVSPTRASSSEISSRGSPSRISQIRSSIGIWFPANIWSNSFMDVVTFHWRKQAYPQGSPSEHGLAPSRSCWAFSLIEPSSYVHHGLKTQFRILFLPTLFHLPTYRTWRCVTDDTAVLFITSFTAWRKSGEFSITSTW